MRLFAIVLFSALFCWGAHAQGGERITHQALVVGISAYDRSIGALDNAVRDATAVADALRRRGFTVLLALNPRRAELERIIDSFGRSSSSADVRIVFFAGHGLEIEGRNYILPSDFSLRGDSPAQASLIAARAISVAQIDGALRHDQGTNLIFLDACRNDPFLAGRAPPPGARGLVGLPVGGVGLRAEAGLRSHVVYATSPGRVAFDGAGGHSPFTMGLLTNLSRANGNFRLFLESLRLIVASNTAGYQIPTWLGEIPVTYLFNESQGNHGRVLEFVSEREQAPVLRTHSFAGLRLAERTAASATPEFFCRVWSSRGWARGGGTATLHTNRNSVGCGSFAWFIPDRLVPATDLRVTEAPANGRVVFEGNAWAYIPNPNFVGEDSFAMEGMGFNGGYIPMRGRVSVRVE